MIWHRLPADYISEGLRLEELEKFFYENSDYRTSLNTRLALCNDYVTFCN